MTTPKGLVRRSRGEKRSAEESWTMVAKITKMVATEFMIDIDCCAGLEMWNNCVEFVQALNL